MATDLLGTLGLGGAFNVSGVFSIILNIILIVGVVAIFGGIFYAMYKFKGSGKSDLKQICWYEEVADNLLELDIDKAKEITVPGTNLKVFYVKAKDLWLPRFSRGMSKSRYYVAITPDREIVNFTLGSLSKDRKNSGLHYDHTDMRWAAENTREFIKRNYRDKATPWWKEYKEIISVAILLLLMTFCFVIIIFFFRDLAADLGQITGTVGGYIDKLNACNPLQSGITSAPS